MTIVLLLAFILTCIIVEYIRNDRRKRVLQESFIVRQRAYQLDETKINVPQGLYFSPSHTWAHLQKTGKVRVGIDALLKHMIGSITSIHARGNGETIKKNQALLEIERKGKRLQVYSPISGRISCVNNDVIANAGLISSQPYERGWVYEVEPSNWLEETQTLFLGNNATKWMKKELARLKDFFAFSLAKYSSKPAMAILQEGGQIADKPLENASPEVWKEFQRQFIDQAIVSKN